MTGLCSNYILNLKNMHLSRHVGQDRNVHRKSGLLNCYQALILVHIAECKVAVSFVANFKILQINTSTLELTNWLLFVQKSILKLCSFVKYNMWKCET